MDIHNHISDYDIIRIKTSTGDNIRMKYANTPLQIGLGLMFRKPQDMFFTMPKAKRWKFHTWWCFFKMDIYFIDNGGCVIDHYKNVKPFRTVRASAPAMYVYEVAKK